MADSAFFTPLNHEALLAVRGPDAAKFLQGQLTCNLNYLDERTCSLGARCTPKGRMISSFRIVQEGDGYLLALASELLEAQLADLKKYAVFSKSSLADESAVWARFGLSGGIAVDEHSGAATNDLQQQFELHAVYAWGDRFQQRQARPRILGGFAIGRLDMRLLGGERQVAHRLL